jgi:hypothetical protein
MDFSAFVTIPKSKQGASNSFLFDTGVSENGVIPREASFERGFPYQYPEDQ